MVSVDAQMWRTTSDVYQGLYAHMNPPEGGAGENLDAFHDMLTGFAGPVIITVAHAEQLAPKLRDLLDRLMKQAAETWNDGEAEVEIRLEDR